AIVVGHQHQGRETDLGFAREARLLHRGHTDYIDAPRAIELRFGAARKLWSFDAEVSAAVLNFGAHGTGRRDQLPAKLCADRIGDRDVADDPVAEKTRRTPKGSIDELIGHHQVARRKILAHAAGRADRHQELDAELLETIDVGAVVNFARQQAMAAAVAREEN